MAARQLLVALLLVGLALRAGLAQPPQQPKGTPGAWHNGFFIGFVPKHQKIRLQRERQQESPIAEPLDGAASPDTEWSEEEATVAQTALEHELDSYELPPEIPLEGSYIPVDDGHIVASSSCPDCTAGCHHQSTIRVNAEYLLWWTKESDVPPLVTTSPSGTSQDQAGVLGQSGTTVLFGDQTLLDDSRSGGRFGIGWWIDPAQMHGLDITYLSLEEKTESLTASSRDFAILARPFFNIQDDLQDSRLIAFPDLVEGSVSVSSSTDFQSAEALFRRVASHSPGARMEYLAGYRFGELEEAIRVEESTLSLSGPTVGSTIRLFDNFDIRNRFHGGTLGIRFLGHSDPNWSLEFVAKVALGRTQSEATVSGQTTTSNAAGEATAQSGLLAQSTNIGVFEQDKFSTISELEVVLHRKLCFGLTGSFGYSFLYWTDIFRAADQIDLGINTSQIPPGTLDGAPRPEFPFATSDFWAQGLRFGLECKF